MLGSESERRNKVISAGLMRTETRHGSGVGGEGEALFVAGGQA